MKENNCQDVFCIIHSLHLNLSAAADSKYHRHNIKCISMCESKEENNNVVCQAGCCTSVDEVMNFHLQFLHEFKRSEISGPMLRVSQHYNVQEIIQWVKMVFNGDTSVMHPHILCGFSLSIWYQDRPWTNLLDTHDDSICYYINQNQYSHICSNVPVLNFLQ